MNTKLTKKELLENPKIAQLVREMELIKEWNEDHSAPYGFKDRASRLVVTRVAGTMMYQDQTDKPLSSSSYTLTYLKSAPEFWEPITKFADLIQVKEEKKAYEITSWYDGKNLYSHSLRQVDMHWQIYSVKRLSDSEIFTIGDKINMACSNYLKGNIIDFLVDNHAKSGIYIVYKQPQESESTNHTGDLSQASKARVPIFVTEDGKEIFSGERCYYIAPRDHCQQNYCTWTRDRSSEGYKYFSTKEALNAYVEKTTRKPLFKTEDGVDVFKEDHLPVYWVNIHSFKEGVDKQNHLFEPNLLDYKYFSTKQAAEQYIIYSKPCLSFKDVSKLVVDNKFELPGPIFLSTLERFVENKLKS